MQRHARVHLGQKGAHVQWVQFVGERNFHALTDVGTQNERTRSNTTVCGRIISRNIGQGHGPVDHGLFVLLQNEGHAIGITIGEVINAVNTRKGKRITRERINVVVGPAAVRYEQTHSRHVVGAERRGVITSSQGNRSGVQSADGHRDDWRQERQSQENCSAGFGTNRAMDPSHPHETNGKKRNCLTGTVAQCVLDRTHGRVAVGMIFRYH